jgi:hypothetical protein
MAKRRDEIQAKQKKEQDKIKEDRDRKKRQYQLKGVVRAAFQADNEEKDRKIAEQVAAKKEGMKKDEVKNKEFIKNAVDKGRRQPLLVDRCK